MIKTMEIKATPLPKFTDKRIGDIKSSFFWNTEVTNELSRGMSFREFVNSDIILEAYHSVEWFKTLDKATQDFLFSESDVVREDATYSDHIRIWKKYL